LSSEKCVTGSFTVLFHNVRYSWSEALTCFFQMAVFANLSWPYIGIGAQAPALEALGLAHARR
jgi:hypothetical protein